ncbi:unnamed protein product [Soboliphyme baturini]|uniref:MFS domain-containing protein n=1 Tax=Soboliphyme baturini TaxID=241478 RepID=A0A183IJW1_9BILA|nr:unnamed protein product [Soboliphyme baturini]
MAKTGNGKLCGFDEENVGFEKGVHSSVLHERYFLDVTVLPTADDPCVTSNVEGLKATDVRFKKQTANLGLTWRTVYITSTVVVSGFLLGYCCGVISGAMLIIKTRLRLPNHWQELMVSGTVGAAALSTISSGYMIERFGRKRMIIISTIFFIVGSTVMAASSNKEQFFAGRIIVGLAVGITSCVTPVYVAEITPPLVRGRMLVSYQLMITSGFFCAALLSAAFSYIENDDINWRLMVGFLVGPSISQLFFLQSVPESPRWLAVHGQKHEAERVMMMLNDDSNRSQISAQMDVKQMVEDYMKIRNLRRTKPFRYYSATIIQSGGIQSLTVSMWMTSIAYGVNFLCTIISMFLINRLGRRLLLLYSTFGVLLSCFLMGTGFVLISADSALGKYNETLNSTETLGFDDRCAGLGCDACSYMDQCGYCYIEGGNMNYLGACVAISDQIDEVNRLFYALYGRCALNQTVFDGEQQFLRTEQDAVFNMGYCITAYSWLPIFAMVIYLCSFAVGKFISCNYNAKPILLIYLLEFYPNWARAVGCSISSFINWSFNILISFTFLTLNREITRQGSFFLYGGICIIGYAFFYVVFPETNGLRVEEVENEFDSSWVFAKPW